MLRALAYCEAKAMVGSTCSVWCHHLPEPHVTLHTKNTPTHAHTQTGAEAANDMLSAARSTTASQPPPLPPRASV